MKLSRSLAALLSSSSQYAKWHRLRAAPALQSSALSTDAAAKPAPTESTSAGQDQPRGQEASAEPTLPAGKVDQGGGSPQAPPVSPKEEPPRLPKPSEIPWQVKVANSVHLIGRLGAPIQLGTSPDGTYTAVSALVQEKTHALPQFWIPIVFQGDLAQIAACNLREKDHVYVTGQLTGESPLIDNIAETKMQVMVHSVSYVLELHPEKKNGRNREGLDNSSAEVKNASLVMQLWNDLFANPHKWWDYRTKDSKKSGAFKHKSTGELLEINESTPEWVQSKLDTFVLTSKTSSTGPQSGESMVSQWNELLENPQQWWDNREDKLSGKVKPRYPDFTHKSTKQGLWLDSAPHWVLTKLESSSVSTKPYWQSEAKQTSTTLPAQKEESWRSLMENFDDWWDNRSDKLNPKRPDFKHKKTGEALWLDSSAPKWVMDKLPPQKAKKR